MKIFFKTHFAVEKLLRAQYEIYCACRLFVRKGGVIFESEKLINAMLLKPYIVLEIPSGILQIPCGILKIAEGILQMPDDILKESSYKKGSV